MIGHYDWRGGREALLRFGPDTGPVVVAALPLFEEANRTRAFVVTILRALAARGIGSVLPDLPGQGESLVPLESVRLDDMRTAFAAAASAAGAGSVGLTVRSGALLDPAAVLAGRWRLTPQDGGGLLRELRRLKQSGLERGERLADDWQQRAPVEIGGNLLSPDFLADFGSAVPFNGGPVRTVRLHSDAQPADRRLSGRPLWRSAEPDNDPALAEVLADDIAHWVRTCAG